MFAEAHDAAKCVHQLRPAVQNQQRAIAVAIERHLIGEGSAFGLTFKFADVHGGPTQLPEQSVDEGAHAAQEFHFGQRGVTGDLQTRLQAMWLPSAASTSWGSSFS